MNLRIIAIAACYLIANLPLSAQEITGVQSEIRKMSKETDPFQSVVTKNRIIKDYKLDSLKDSETIDLLNGNVAIAFVKKKNYPEFEKYISLIRNKFNQTSMLNMAAIELLDKKIDADYACKIAKVTLDKYFAFKDDPDARPVGYTKEDWQRFMGFARFPYYDTYAKSLFALKRYSEAIQYQQMAFDGEPEEGLPESVERYAKLLELTGQKEEAKQLLLKMARLGKLNNGMTAQLQSIHASEKGGDTNLSVYIDSLQKTVQATLIQELKSKMINETAQPFSLKDIDGKTVSLSDYRGKIVILDLWATWCVPCIASFPAMQKQIEKHPDVVFLFIAINEKGGDALERVRKFMSKNKYSFHVLMDEPISNTSDKFKITSTYKPTGIPAKYFIDKGGKLRFISKGFSTDTELINETDAIISILKSL
ncbi:MAG: TlpA disulfide reductase family protein [Bacteroidales bacterium]|nr:TlpA disulfide reductase family protein [Bacteroidales bacterium]